jgi:hypothetical protein
MRGSVIPLETGIRSFQYRGRFRIPACAGITTLYDFIIYSIGKIYGKIIQERGKPGDPIGGLAPGGMNRRAGQ